MNALARTVLRQLAWFAYPALAGAGFIVLSLGVVTWLPALAAMAHSLRRWHRHGEERCFTGVFTAFPRYARALFPHSVVSTVVAMLIVMDIGFLVGRPEPMAFVLLCGLSGGVIAYVLYHVGLAVAAACEPDGRPTRWRRRAMVLAFGSPRRTLTWLATVIAVPVLSLIVPFGPLLLGPSVPVLVGLTSTDTVEPPMT